MKVVLSAEPALEGAGEEVRVSDVALKVAANNEREKIDESDLPENNISARVIKPIPQTDSSKQLAAKAA